jgi:transposase
MRPATHYGFGNTLWTCRRIKDVLRKELRLSVSVPTVWRGLRILGLSCQKPERRAIEQDPVARREWLEEEWPAIRALAKKENALLFFQDEAGIHLTPTVGHTWGKAGRRPTIPVTGKRGCISTMSAVTPDGRLFFMIPRERVNASVFISFLMGLLRENPRRKVFVIADQASSHTARGTKEFVKSEPRLKLFYLPPYSPDYNPDERVWDHLKNHAMAGHSATNKSVLRRKTLRALRTMQSHPALVRSFYLRTPVSLST